MSTIDVEVFLLAVLHLEPSTWQELTGQITWNTVGLADFDGLEPPEMSLCLTERHGEDRPPAAAQIEILTTDEGQIFFWATCMGCHDLMVATK